MFRIIPCWHCSLGAATGLWCCELKKTNSRDNDTKRQGYPRMRNTIQMLRGGWAASIKYYRGEKTNPITSKKTASCRPADPAEPCVTVVTLRPCLIWPKPDLDFKIRILKPWGSKQTECWIRIRFLENKCKILDLVFIQMSKFINFIHTIFVKMSLFCFLNF